MKTKTYVLTLSTRFPKGHPREGEETHFEDYASHAVYNATHTVSAYDERFFKIHTIRTNYELWKRRIDEVNAGRAVLSVRQWLGAPRRSKQRELFRLDSDRGVGVELVHMELKHHNIKNLTVWTSLDVSDGKGGSVQVDEEILARNDGLSSADWRSWFRDVLHSRTERKDSTMAIIHFTNFRYNRL